MINVWFLLSIIPQLIIAFIGVWLAIRKIEDKRHQLIIFILIALSIITSAVLQFQSDRKNQQNFDRKLLKFENDFIAINNSNRSTKDKREIITYKYRELHGNSDIIAEKRIEELIESQEELIDDLATISKKENELKDLLDLKWVPFIEIILEEFDANINAFKKHGVNVELYKINHPNFINFYNTSVDTFLLRKVTFPNGTYIRIECAPAIIREGKLLSLMVIHFKDTNTSSGAFLLAFREEMVMLQEIGGTGSETVITPLDDEEFVSKVKEAVIKLIERVYIDDLQKVPQEKK